MAGCHVSAASHTGHMVKKAAPAPFTAAVSKTQRKKNPAVDNYNRALSGTDWHVSWPSYSLHSVAVFAAAGIKGAALGGPLGGRGQVRVPRRIWWTRLRPRPITCWIFATDAPSARSSLHNVARRSSRRSWVALFSRSSSTRIATSFGSSNLLGARSTAVIALAYLVLIASLSACRHMCTARCTIDRVSARSLMRLRSRRRFSREFLVRPTWLTRVAQKSEIRREEQKHGESQR